MVFKIEPGDLEIDTMYGPIGTIIHIFPETANPNNVSIDIVKGLSVLKKIEQLHEDIEKLLLEPSLDDNTKEVYSTIRDMVDKTLKDAENETIEFFENDLYNNINQGK